MKALTTTTAATTVCAEVQFAGHLSKDAIEMPNAFDLENSAY